MGKTELCRYLAVVSVPLPIDHINYLCIQRKLNLMHCGVEQPPIDMAMPDAVKHAHWYLNAGRNQEVEVAIYSDGSREIVGIVKEDV